MTRVWSNPLSDDQFCNSTGPVVALIVNPRYGHLAIAFSNHDGGTWVAYTSQNYCETYGEIGMFGPVGETLDSFIARARTF